MSLNDEKRILLTRCLAPKYFYGHVECSLDNPAENFRTEGQKFSAECPEMFRKNFFFGNTRHPQNIPVNTKKVLSTNLQKTIQQKL